MLGETSFCSTEKLVCVCVPCVCSTTRPSVLALVRAMKKPSTCIIGDAASSLSSAAPCWPGGDSTGERERGTERVSVRQSLHLKHGDSPFFVHQVAWFITIPSTFYKVTFLVCVCVFTCVRLLAALQCL